MNILVIDDQAWRRKYYSKLESLIFNYKVTFIDETEVHSIDNNYLRGIDLILLDVHLHGEWKLKSCDAARIIRYVNKAIPIVLITGNWAATNNTEIEVLSTHYDTEAAPLPFTDLLSMEEFNNLSGEQADKRDPKGISEQNISYLGRTLMNIYGKRKKQKYLDKDSGEPIFILHLSDMQLGGQHEKSSLLDPASIANQVKNQHGIPDFICITGDIAENGYASEFSDAREWIIDLCESFKWEFPYDRLLLCPGNHDVLSSTFGTCKYEYKRGDTNKPGKLSHLDDVELKIPNISNLSLNNFNRFAFKLTNNIDWLTNEECYWLDSRYLACGINFIGINTLGQNSFNSPFKGLPNGPDYKALRKELVNTSIGDNILNIALFHHPELVDDMCFKAFSEVNPAPSLLLAGHEHKSKFVNLREQQQLLCIAPTSSLQAKLRWPDANRGFSIIELNRVDGAIKALKEYSYIRVNNRWINTGDNPHFDYMPGTGNIWREVYKD